MRTAAIGKTITDSLDGAADAPGRLEQRETERRSFVLYLARIEADGVKELCRVRNLSAGGLMAELLRPLRVGARVRVDLPCEGMISARVVWVKGFFTGVRFEWPIRSPCDHRPTGACAEDLALQHEYLGLLADALAATVNAAGPPDLAATLQGRQRFTQALRTHLKQEDWAVYPELLRSADPRVTATAQRFHDEMGCLDAQLVAYSGRWTSGAIAADWPGFRRETDALLASFRRRAAREDAELYPLLTAAGR